MDIIRIFNHNIFIFLQVLAIICLTSICECKPASDDKNHDKRGVQEFGARIKPTKRESSYAGASLHQTFYTTSNNAEIHPHTNFDDIQLYIPSR